jgi:ankyrin repeat protein
MVQLLLDRGADPARTWSFGETALHRAALRRHADAVRLLLAAKADADRRDSFGLTPLHHAVKRGTDDDMKPYGPVDPEVIDLLVAAGADLVYAVERAQGRANLPVAELLAARDRRQEVTDRAGEPGR